MKLIQSLSELSNIPQGKRDNCYLSEDILKNYPIKDNKEKLVDVLELFHTNGVSVLHVPPEDIKDFFSKVLLRETSAQKILSAAKKLPKNIVFKISEGYRPLWYQRKIYNEIYAQVKKGMPYATEREVYEQTTTYVADPNLCPPHSTGGTLDLTLSYHNGKELDMGTQLNTVDEKSNTFANGLTSLQKKNRKLLLTTLKHEGFVNIASEWWHYSYGDQYWAVIEGKPFALYNSLDFKTSA